MQAALSSFPVSDQTRRQDTVLHDNSIFLQKYGFVCALSSDICILHKNVKVPLTYFRGNCTT